MAGHQRKQPFYPNMICWGGGRSLSGWLIQRQFYSNALDELGDWLNNYIDSVHLTLEEKPQFLKK